MATKTNVDNGLATFVSTLEAVVPAGGTYAIPFTVPAGRNLTAYDAKVFVGTNNAYPFPNGAAGWTFAAGSITVRNNTGLAWPVGQQISFTLALPLIPKPALPVPAAGDVGKALVVQADGTYALVVPASGGGVEKQIGATVVLTGSNANFDFGAIVPTSAKGNKATVVEVEIVGGGGSGFAAWDNGSHPGNGGNPGQAVVRRFNVADIPNVIPYSVGAGGSTVNSINGGNIANAGSDSFIGTVPRLQALGGTGGIYIEPGDISAGHLLTPGNIPSGRPGRTNTTAGLGGLENPLLTAASGMGPGGGGAGSVFGGGTSGGRGGDAGVHLPNSRTAGGRGANQNVGFAALAGQNAVDEFGFGAGGGAAGSPGSLGAAGGFPGGGGGGGGAQAGGGGNGTIRLRFRGVE